MRPLYLKVENESHRHQVPSGSETHFKITLVSPKFDGLTPLQRHRYINQLLKNELNTGLHALTMALYDSSQNIEKLSPQKSPPCKDGYKDR